MCQHCIWASLVLFSKSLDQEALFLSSCGEEFSSFLCKETSFLNSYQESEMCRLVKVDGEISTPVCSCEKELDLRVKHN